MPFAIGGEEHGVVGVLLEGLGGRQRIAVLGLESRHDIGVFEEVLAIEVYLDEGFHRHAEEIAIGRS